MANRRGPWNTLEDIDESIASLEADTQSLLSMDWQESVLDRFDPTGGLPGSPSEGDRYLSTATANGWNADSIYEYKDGAWSEVLPSEGMATWVEDENKLYFYDGASWVSFGSAVTHNNLGGLQGGTIGEYYHLTQTQEGWIDQDVSIGSSPTFNGANISGIGDDDTRHIHSSIFPGQATGNNTSEYQGILPQNFQRSVFVIFHDKLFCISGGGFGSTFTNVYSSFDGLNWTSEGNLPAGRYQGGGIEFKGKLYYAGGIDSAGNPKTEIYESSDGKTWAKVGDLPAGLNSYGMVEYSGSVYIYGGDVNNVRQSAVYRSSDMVTWTNIGSLPVACRHLGAVVFNDKMWKVGGDGDGAVRSSTDGITWTLESNPNLTWTGGATVMDGKIWLLGWGFGGGADDIIFSSDGVNWTTKTDVIATQIWGAGSFNTIAYKGRIFKYGGQNEAPFSSNFVVYTHYKMDSEIEVVDKDGNQVMALTPSGMALNSGATVDTIETTLTDDDTHLPTSGAVVDYISGTGPHTRLHSMTDILDHQANNWKLFHSNGSGQIIELALGAVNTVLQGNGVSAAPTMAQLNHSQLGSIGADDHHGADLIAEGDSKVEVIDAGTGDVQVTVDGGQEMSINASGMQLASGARVDTIETTITDDDTHLPTSGAVKDYADGLLAANDAMVYKGAIDASTNPNYPSADAGHTYKISNAGKIGGASGEVVEVGDMAICLVDSSPAGDQATVGANWNVIQVNIDGAVIGPSSSTDNAIARFDLATGKLIQNSLATIDDSGGINIPSGQTYDINGSPHGHSQLHDRLHSITDTLDHQANTWKLFYSNGSGNIIELALGAANTVLQGNGVAAAPTMAQLTHSQIGSIGADDHHGADLIAEGDSKVEVIDAGNGEITIVADAEEVAEFTNSRIYLGNRTTYDDWIDIDNNNGQIKFAASNQIRAFVNVNGLQINGKLTFDNATTGADIDVVSPNILELYNKNDGNGIRLMADDAGGTKVSLLTSDPDGAVELYYAGVKKIETAAGGIKLENGATVDTIETTITDDDTHIPTSGAVVDYVTGFTHDKIGEGNSSVEVIDAGTGDVQVVVDAGQEMSITASGMQLATGARVDNIETTLTDDDTHLPTSGAVKDYVDANAGLPTYQQAASESQDSHTGDSNWQTKVTLSATGLVVGKVYKIEFHGELTSTKNSQLGPYMRTMIDGTTEIAQICATLEKDYVDGIDQWHSMAGFYLFTATATSHSFTIQYALDPGQTSETVYARRCRLMSTKIT